jgi:hypothetical protein
MISEAFTRPIVAYLDLVRPIWPPKADAKPAPENHEGMDPHRPNEVEMGVPQ